MFDSKERAAILRAPDVCAILNISKPSLYSWIRRGRFPRGTRYGPRLVGWRRETVDEWVRSRVATLSQGQGA